MSSRFSIDEEMLDAAIAELQGYDTPDEDEYDLEWEPSLNPKQRECFECSVPYILAYGERGSGKTIGFCHKTVRHLIHNRNALVVIIVRVRSMATEGGLWEKLAIDVLPQWREGMGLVYTDERMNESRIRYRFVKNKFGGWSKMVLLSIEHGQQLKDKIKGFEPSMVFLDELTTFKDPAFFTAVVQQIGRRPDIDEVQQYVASTNPEGPSHWVYKRFFEFPQDTKKKPDDYKVFHIPISENIDNLPEGYYDRVMEGVSDDPVEYRRMVGGEWIDRPSDYAIFRSCYSAPRHVVGEGIQNIIPNPEFPCILGYDLGTANNAIGFMQQLPFEGGKIKWVVFDEMIYLDSYIYFGDLVPEIMRRMRFWNEITGAKLFWEHISDDSAMNQFRNTTGSYDAMEFERISREFAPEYPELDPIEMVPAPKFSGSIERRVRLLYKLLQRDEIVFSHQCVEFIQMLLNLEGEKENMFQRKHNRYSHPFDALTYPILHYTVGGDIARRGDQDQASVVKIAL